MTLHEVDYLAAHKLRYPLCGQVMLEMEGTKRGIEHKNMPVGACFHARSGRQDFECSNTLRGCAFAFEVAVQVAATL